MHQARTVVPTFTSSLLLALTAFNVVFGVVVALLLASTVLAESVWLAQLAGTDRSTGPLIQVLRLSLGLCLLAVGPAHLVLTRLRAMVATVRGGVPFQLANAGRLRVIAWSLLALQLLDVAFGGLAWAFREETGDLVTWNVGLTGWLAVLLLFVLAGVFERGATMHDELAGTV